MFKNYYIENKALNAELLHVFKLYFGRKLPIYKVKFKSSFCN